MGDKAVLMVALWLGVFSQPLKGLLLKGFLKLPHYLGKNVASVLIGGGLAV